MRTSFSHRRIGICAVALVAAMLLLVAAGCGGSSKKNSAAATSTAAMTTVSVNDWANGFCSAVGNWATSIRSVGTTLRGNPTKSNLQSATATIKNANQTLVASLQSLGRPDTQRGAQAKKTIDELATSLKSHSDQINSAVKSSSGAGAAAAISTNLVAMGQAFQTSLSQLKTLNEQSKGSLKKAFDQSSACQKIQSQQG